MVSKAYQLACIMIVLTCVGFPSTSQSDDWPQWLGTNRDAVWSEDGILEQFPEEGPRLRWKTKLGAGYSGPAVAKGRVFVMDRLMPALAPAKARLLHDGTPPRTDGHRVFALALGAELLHLRPLGLQRAPLRARLAARPHPLELAAREQHPRPAERAAGKALADVRILVQRQVVVAWPMTN